MPTPVRKGPYDCAGTRAGTEGLKG